LLYDGDHNALIEEKAWVQRAQEDIRGFEPLYNKYYALIFRYIYRRTDSMDLALDLCSQTFYKALSGIRKYKWTGRPFGAWLYRIAANEIRKHFRNQKEVFVIEEEKARIFFPHEEVPGPRVEDLVRAFQLLSEAEVELIELKYFEELTFRDIGLMWGQKESAVKMRVYRTLAKMKTIIVNGHEKV